VSAAIAVTALHAGTESGERVVEGLRRIFGAYNPVSTVTFRDPDAARHSGHRLCSVRGAQRFGCQQRDSQCQQAGNTTIAYLVCVTVPSHELLIRNRILQKLVLEVITG
jgi:hypothetical protein